MNFDNFNIIAGPNDSGKTNIFRILNFIGDSFNYRDPSISSIVFQGDSDLSLSFELTVELDQNEIDLISTSILCSEIYKVEKNEDTLKIKNNNNWKDILLNYGNLVISKTFKQFSLLLLKNEYSTSEARLIYKFSDDSQTIFMNRNGYFSKTNEEPNPFQNLSLSNLILDYFFTRYGNTDLEVKKTLNEKTQFNDCPSLTELMFNNLDNGRAKIFDLSGIDIDSLKNNLRNEPYVAKLLSLLRLHRIKQSNNLRNIIEDLYKNSFVSMHELRISGLEGGSSIDKTSTIIGSNLALKLFWLMNSGIRHDREKYNNIKNEFKNLSGSEFDIAIRVREISDASEGSLGVLAQSVPAYTGIPQFTPLGLGNENRIRKINEAYIQIIQKNFPMAIEQSASGLYEILFLLTTIIGETNKVLLLDEPELHLHPNMQKRVLDLLYNSKDKSENQILLITHSPYLVSEDAIGSTWRFSKKGEGTKIHNLGNIISDFNIQEKQQLAVKLNNSDIRSLLFSNGVIFVEGLSDKIAIENIDNYLSTKGIGAELSEKEWSVIVMGGKKSLVQYIILSQLLGVPWIAIMDYDALMYKDSKITTEKNELKTSVIMSALWRTGYLKKQHFESLSSGLDENKWYDQSRLQELKQLSEGHAIFVFSSDLEGVIQTQNTGKTSKPLKSLEKVIELINLNNIPSEFNELTEFLKKNI